MIDRESHRAGSLVDVGWGRLLGDHTPNQCTGTSTPAKRFFRAANQHWRNGPPSIHSRRRLQASPPPPATPSGGRGGQGPPPRRQGRRSGCRFWRPAVARVLHRGGARPSASSCAQPLPCPARSRADREYGRSAGQFPPPSVRTASKAPKGPSRRAGHLPGGRRLPRTRPFAELLQVVGHPGEQPVGLRPFLASSERFGRSSRGRTAPRRPGRWARLLAGYPVSNSSSASLAASTRASRTSGKAAIGVSDASIVSSVGRPSSLRNRFVSNRAPALLEPKSMTKIAASTRRRAARRVPLREASCHQAGPGGISAGPRGASSR